MDTVAPTDELFCKTVNGIHNILHAKVIFRFCNVWTIQLHPIYNSFLIMQDSATRIACWVSCPGPERCGSASWTSVRAGAAPRMTRGVASPALSRSSPRASRRRRTRLPGTWCPRGSSKARLWSRTLSTPSGMRSSDCELDLCAISWYQFMSTVLVKLFVYNCVWEFRSWYLLWGITIQIKLHCLIAELLWNWNNFKCQINLFSRNVYNRNNIFLMNNSNLLYFIQENAWLKWFNFH